MKTKVLMVCLGNICRSPMAEGLLSAKCDPTKIEVDSAGTANYHVGDAPDERMIATAKSNGIDISHLRGRQFGKEDFKNFDYIYVMDKSNYENVLQLADTSEDREKVELILNLLSPGENPEVPDPYYGGNEGFQHVYALLDQSTDVILKNLQ